MDGEITPDHGAVPHIHGSWIVDHVCMYTVYVQVSFLLDLLLFVAWKKLTLKDKIADNFSVFFFLLFFSFALKTSPPFVTLFLPCGRVNVRPTDFGRAFQHLFFVTIVHAV